MKFALIAVILTAAVVAGFSGREENGQIKFEMDVHKESPVGLYVSGLLDPRAETNNKIQAFLKLANQYIPILQSIANKDNSLSYEYNYRISLPGITIDVNVYLQLLVGWKVNPGTYSASFYEVTYTPFVYGYTIARFNGTSWPAFGMTKSGLVFADATAPIGVTLYTERKICFGGRYLVNPVRLQTDVFAALNACEGEIIDKILNQQPITLGCNYTNPVNFTLIQKNFTSTYAGDLIPQMCFNF